MCLLLIWTSESCEKICFRGKKISFPYGLLLPVYLDYIINNCKDIKQFKLPFELFLVRCLGKRGIKNQEKWHMNHEHRERAERILFQFGIFNCREANTAYRDGGSGLPYMNGCHRPLLPRPRHVCGEVCDFPLSSQRHFQLGDFHVMPLWTI